MMFSHPPDDLTDDALTDRMRVFQRRGGHRYSVDDVATAWLALRACEPGSRSCLDLGCGIGSVLLMLADRLPSARVVGVEAQAASYALAERNVERNGMVRRVSVQFGDLRDSALLDRILQAEAAFGREGGFDLVTGTPPYKPLGTASLSPDPQRAHARVELRGGVEAYLAAAARVLEAAGVFVMCAQSELAPRVAAGARKVGLTPVYRVDVIPRLGHKTRLFSVHAFVRDAVANAAEGGERVRARLRASALEPGAEPDCEQLVLRDEAGERTPAARALRAYFGLFDDQADARPCVRRERQDREETALAGVEQGDSAG